MLRLLATYLATGLALAGVDFIWLTKAQALYRPTLNPVLADQVNLGAALAFYLVYVTGVTSLAVVPAGRAGSVRRGALTGAALGAFAYATYDLTNQSTLKVWSTTITLADISWGTFLTAVAASVGTFVYVRLSPRNPRP
ncbi:DUF2177 family protein [Phenylobacterium aquaticum]|uniref:DUF2177 family protein n=1 Tax=Phenylobacterium aquaticum TaxID=1763816 RepID=UPI001F5C0BF7|nr:DUF2177 family protein [Phenylobacterium aquaticum]MCI3131774.1 DUF2177 family protein [Phenylobacterium aquaticum]